VSATSPSRAAAVAVVLLAGLLPLSTSPFVTDTTMASWSLTAAVGVGVAMLAPARDSPPRRLWLACAAGIGVFVAAALVGSTAALSLLGRYPRYEGVITVVGYALALAAGARILGPNSDHRHLFARALSVSSVVTAVVAAGQAVFLPDQRVVGLLGNSSVLGGWAAVTFCLLGWWYLERRDWLILGGAVASALTLVLAASRAAWLGVAVALVASLLVRRAVSIRPPWGLPVGALGVLGIAALLLPGSQARATGSAPFADATVSGRLLLWQDTWPMLWSHPVLGVGPSVFVDAIAGFHTPAWAAMVGPYAPPDSPHNTVLQFLAATGFVGLVAAGLVAVVLVGAVSRSRPWDGWQAGAIAAGFALGCSGLFSFTDPATATLGLVVLGGAVARPLPSSAPARSAWPGRTAIAVWLAAAVALPSSALLAEARYSGVLAQRTASASALVAVADTRPWDPDLAIRIGATFADLAGRGAAPPQPAIPLVQRACAQLPRSVECRLTLGDLQTLAGDAAGAIRTLAVARQLDPTNVDVLLKLGIAQAENGAVDDAEASFTSAANLRPSAPEPWQDLAELYRRTGRTADAEQAQARAEQLGRR